MIIYPILATLSVSLIAFLIALLIGKDTVEKLFLKNALLGVAAGVLITISFIHLIPESLGELGIATGAILIVAFILLFFFLEKFIKIRHCHNEECDLKEHISSGYLVIIGDGVHNFIDGLIIAFAFSVSLELGFVITISVILHELPQELGDVAILRNAGFSYGQTIMWNTISGVAALVGGLIGYVAIENIEPLKNYLLPVAASSFLYIAMGDIIPSLHRYVDNKNSIMQFLGLIIGVVIMFYIFVNFNFESKIHSLTEHKSESSVLQDHSYESGSHKHKDNDHNH